jgi:hypothetical protein
VARRGRGAGEQDVDAPGEPARERATASYSKGFIALPPHVAQRGGDSPSVGEDVIVAAHTDRLGGDPTDLHLLYRALEYSGVRRMTVSGIDTQSAQPHLTFAIDRTWRPRNGRQNSVLCPHSEESSRL